MPEDIKKGLKTWGEKLMRLGFEAGRRLHIDILPRRFFSQAPDIKIPQNIKASHAPRSMIGISGAVDDQLAWVDECTRPYRAGLRSLEVHKMAVRMSGSDDAYGEVDAEFLYCFIRSQRPRKIVHIGSGVPTAVCLLAAKDEGFLPQITCIQPEPTTFLQREAESGRITLVNLKTREVGITSISSLEKGDLLLVNSTDTLARAGELNFVILEILPRLPAGAYAHFNDIYFPYDYGTGTLTSAVLLAHETALLYAFLLMNHRFEVAASLSMLHHDRLKDFVRLFPDKSLHQFGGTTNMSGHFPSSIFLRSRIS